MSKITTCFVLVTVCLACRRDAPVSLPASISWPTSARDVWEGGLRKDWVKVGLAAWLASIPVGLEADAMFSLASDPDMKPSDWKVVASWSRSIIPGSDALSYIWLVQMCYEFNEVEWSREELLGVVADGAPWNVLKAVRILCRDTADSSKWVADAERWANGLMSGSVKKVGGSLGVNDPPLRRLGAAIRLVMASSGIDVSRIEDKW